MRALVLTRYGGPENVVFAEIPRPVPKRGEILVQVHAAGLNPIDNMIPKGSFKPVLKLALPATMGSDLAGVVVEVGAGVTRFKEGDEVFASLFDLDTGALAELAVVPESAAALKPSNVDFVPAASVPMVGLTTWQALTERARVRPGQKVFVPAGSGGIGTFAIQLAKHLGAKVGTTTSGGNVELVKRLGASEIVDYTKQELTDVLRGYDVVLGTLRGRELEKSLRVLAPNGLVVSLVGPLDADFARARKMGTLFALIFSLMSFWIRWQARKLRVRYSFLFVHPSGSQLAEIGELLRAGTITPVVDRVFPFDQAKEALAYLATGRAKGKVVVQMR
ncbi:MAG: NADP-dependent oxidoreductase [Polyangiaceae bacterium]|nr:NADP-dependent oxidoreductase [Polyangiaceae bacterium]